MKIVIKEVKKFKILSILLINILLISTIPKVYGLNKQNFLFFDLDKKNFLSYNNLTFKILERARFLFDKGKFEESAELYKKYINKVKKIFGPESSHLIDPTNELAITYAELNKPDLAIENYLKAIYINTNLNGEFNENNGIFYENLSITNWEVNKYSAAEKNIKRSIKIYEKIYKDKQIEFVDTLQTLADIYSDQGDFLNSIDIDKRILKIKEDKYGLNHPEVGITLNLIGLSYWELGKLKTAKPFLKRSIKILEKKLGRNNIETINSLNNLALVYGDEGNWDKSIPIFRNILEISLKNNFPTTNIANNLGTDLYKNGDFEDAKLLLEKYLKKNFYLEKNYENLLARASILDNLSYISFQEQIYKDAINYSLDAIEILKGIRGANNIETADKMLTIAQAYTFIGGYEKSNFYYQKAISIYEKVWGKDHFRTAYAKRDRAFNLEYNARNGDDKSQFKEILKTYLDVYKVFSNWKDIHFDHIALITQDIGRINYIIGNLKEAKEFTEKSLAINIENYRYMAMADNYSVLGFLALEERKVNLAIDYFKKEVQLRIDNNSPKSRFLSDAYFNLATAYAANNSEKDFILNANKAFKIQLDLIKKEAPFIPSSNRHKFVNSFGGAVNSVFSLSKDTNLGNRIALETRLNRQGLLQEIERFQSKSLSNQKGKELYKKLDKLIRRKSNISLDNDLLKKLENEQELLEREIYKILPSFKSKYVDIEKISGLLNSNSILIEYQKYKPYMVEAPYLKKTSESQYLAFILLPNQKVHRIELGSSKVIDKKIKNALNASEEGLSDAIDLWQEVAELIIKPIEKYTKNFNTWYVSLDSELNRVPISALKFDRSKIYINDSINLRLVTTGRELIDLKQNTKNENKGNLIFANPDFNLKNKNIKDNLLISDLKQRRSKDSLSKNWIELPGTAKEGIDIKNITDGKLFTNEKASVSNLENLTNPNLLHFATHSYFLKDNKDGENHLLRSGIVLAGANNPNLNAEDDGYLTALEITKLDWIGTEIVVVSGCESGQGEIKSGEGVYGLKRAITVAGGKSSLLSLWKVNDRSTAAFMKSFYEKLKDGKGKNIALALTQKEFRDHPIKAWRHPNVWAAFQLSGDWRPIKW